MLGGIVQTIRSCVGDADLMLIGAAARDLLLQHLHGIDTRRKTNDVDLAFAVADWPAYETMKAALVASGEFEPSKRIHHRLLCKIGLPIDIVPFGGIESPNAEIAWPPDGNDIMSVIGYVEARSAADDILLPGDEPLAVPTLPMFALLKLFAWEDRYRIQPGKDATDLLFVLDNAFRTMGLELLYETAPELLEADDFDVDLAGAWMLGADVRTTIDRFSRRCQAILAKVSTTLEREVDPDGSLTLIGQIHANDPERARLKLIAFGNGVYQVAMLTRKGFGKA